MLQQSLVGRELRPVPPDPKQASSGRCSRPGAGAAGSSAAQEGAGWRAESEAEGEGQEVKRIVPAATLLRRPLLPPCADAARNGRREAPGPTRHRELHTGLIAASRAVAQAQAGKPALTSWRLMRRLAAEASADQRLPDATSSPTALRRASRAPAPWSLPASGHAVVAWGSLLILYAGCAAGAAATASSTRVSIMSTYLARRPRTEPVSPIAACRPLEWNDHGRPDLPDRGPEAANGPWRRGARARTIQTVLKYYADAGFRHRKR